MAKGVPEVVRGEGYEIRIVGGPSLGLSDLYHGLLRASWPTALTVIVGSYLFLNVIFAILFLVVGGVANIRSASFLDAFYFSVQTMGTIGYGYYYPISALAGALVVAESVAGLLVTALATGLVFARFARTRSRIRFCSRIAISPVEGVPTLQVRLGNERRNRIIDITFRLLFMRMTRTREGVVIYRYEDLALVRHRAPGLARSFSVMHQIVPGSPLFGHSPESLATCEAEITLTAGGIDDVSLQPVHAHKVWMSDSIVFGARLADVLSETPDGNMILDLGRFHELVDTEPTSDFPYPRQGVGT